MGDVSDAWVLSKLKGESSSVIILAWMKQETESTPGGQHQWQQPGQGGQEHQSIEMTSNAIRVSRLRMSIALTLLLVLSVGQLLAL
jgi:hypothetical protein